MGFLEDAIKIGKDFVPGSRRIEDIDKEIKKAAGNAPEQFKYLTAGLGMSLKLLKAHTSAMDQMPENTRYQRIKKKFRQRFYDRRQNHEAQVYGYVTLFETIYKSTLRKTEELREEIIEYKGDGSADSYQNSKLGKLESDIESIKAEEQQVDLDRIKLKDGPEKRLEALVQMAQENDIEPSQDPDIRLLYTQVQQQIDGLGVKKRQVRSRYMALVGNYEASQIKLTTLENKYTSQLDVNQILGNKLENLAEDVKRFIRNLERDVTFEKAFEMAHHIQNVENEMTEGLFDGADRHNVQYGQLLSGEGERLKALPVARKNSDDIVDDARRARQSFLTSGGEYIAAIEAARDDSLKRRLGLGSGDKKALGEAPEDASEPDGLEAKIRKKMKDLKKDS